jgi:hypothetical protein
MVLMHLFDSPLLTELMPLQPLQPIALQKHLLHSSNNKGTVVLIMGTEMM